MQSEQSIPTYVTTDEYWDVDGVPLNTLAYNIQTWGGTRQTPPPLRGANVVVPGHRGSLWQAKVMDERVMTLAFWVIGANEDGSVPLSGMLVDKFRTNYRKLMKLLWRPGNERVKLTKRFWDSESNSVVPIEAFTYAEFGGGLEPEMTGNSRATFTIDYVLSDPVFQGLESEIRFDRTTDQETQAIFLGDVDSDQIEIELVGPLTNSVIALKDVGQLSVPIVISTGDRVVIDVPNYRAMYYPAEGLPYSVSGAINSNVGLEWMRVNRGLGQINFTASAGSGHGFFRHRPLWL